MKIIVGLGNPGREYVGTRHNIGFEVIDALAVRLGWIFRPEEFERMARSNFDAFGMDGAVPLPGLGSEKVLLLKPMTYMNLSGRPIQQAMKFYQATPQDIMVVLDDLALPAGRLRIRSSGTSGGHNGLKDIERMLGTMEYPRLRVGIDAPPPYLPGKDYVLQRFTPEQRKAIDGAVQRACGALIMWLEKGISPAMNQFNAEEKQKNDEA